MERLTQCAREAAVLHFLQVQIFLVGSIAAETGRPVIVQGTAGFVHSRDVPAAEFMRTHRADPTMQ